MSRTTFRFLSSSAGMRHHIHSVFIDEQYQELEADFLASPIPDTQGDILENAETFSLLTLNTETTTFTHMEWFASSRWDQFWEYPEFGNAGPRLLGSWQDALRHATGESFGRKAIPADFSGLQSPFYFCPFDWDGGWFDFRVGPDDPDQILFQAIQCS